jgi:hypothetical protein
LGTLAVTRACAGTYPEIGGLLSDQLAILRRSVIHCLPQPKPGANLPPHAEPIQSEATPEGHGRRVGEPPRFSLLYYIYMYGDLASFNNATSVEYRLQTYFHEPLHYTGANNLADHNSVENIPYDQRHPCQRDCLDDRIVFLQTLCGFPTVATMDDIVDRLQRCPEAGKPPDGPGGCLWMLRHSEANARVAEQDPHFYGTLFSEEEAPLFCGRIISRTAPERLSRARRRTVSTRFKLTFVDVLDRQGRTLLTDAPTPAARYLAPLPARDRAALSANASMTRLGALCRGGSDGSIDPLRQSYDCPLGNGNPLYPLTRRLVEFNNLEARLNSESRRLLDALVANMDGRPAEPLDQIETEVRALYSELCPDPAGNEFYPRLCDNGRTVLLEDLAAVREALRP